MTAAGPAALAGSVVADLDPRTKILAALLATTALVLSASLTLRAVVVVVLVGAWFAARCGLRALLLTVGSLLFFFTTTMVLRSVIRSAGAADVVRVAGIPVSPSGALDGLAMCLQILGIVLALALLVRATAPVLLCDGMERLLRPLQRWGVPTQEGTLMFSIALRFLPMMTTEFGRLQTAQLARGGGGHRQGLRQRVRALLPLLIPLFVVTLRRAKELSEAMDSRGYSQGGVRTSIRELRITTADRAVVLTAVLAVVAAAATRW